MATQARGHVPNRFTGRHAGVRKLICRAGKSRPEPFWPRGWCDFESRQLGRGPRNVIDTASVVVSNPSHASLRAGLVLCAVYCALRAVLVLAEMV